MPLLRRRGALFRCRWGCPSGRPRQSSPTDNKRQRVATVSLTRGHSARTRGGDLPRRFASLTAAVMSRSSSRSLRCLTAAMPSRTNRVLGAECDHVPMPLPVLASNFRPTMPRLTGKDAARCRSLPFHIECNRHVIDAFARLDHTFSIYIGRPSITSRSSFVSFPLSFPKIIASFPSAKCVRTSL